MYNAIKLIDGTTLLDDDKKKRLINLISRFGKKWIEYDFVEKYQLIQNLPPKYCNGYNLKDYFPNILLKARLRHCLLFMK